MRKHPPLGPFLTVAVFVLAGLWGCGYRVASASRTVKGDSIAVSPFENRTTTFEVEQILTREIHRTLVRKSGYRVVNKPSEADVVMSGEITSVSAVPVVFGRETFGSAFLVTLNAKVELKDRRSGKTFFRNDNYVFRDQYETNSDVKNFFSELNPALERIAADFASSVVTAVLEDF